MDLSKLLTYQGITLDIIVWSLFVGVVLALLVIFLTKRVTGAYVRRLLDAKAHTPETALTMRQLGVKSNILIRLQLREKGTLRKVVIANPVTASVQAPAVDGAPVKKSAAKKRSADLADTPFFIPENKIDRAARLFDATSASLFNILLAVLALIVVAVISFTVIPDLIDMFKDLFGLSEQL